MKIERLMEIVKQAIMEQMPSVRSNAQAPRTVVPGSNVRKRIKARGMYGPNSRRHGSGLERTNATINPPRGRN